METMRSIIEKCKKAKEENGYTFDMISEESGVPKSTVLRFFSDKGASCRYDTVYPIVRFLMGFDDEVPEEPKQIEAVMPLPPQDMILWYRDIITKRESEYEKLIAEHKTELSELKAEHRQEISEIKAEHRKMNMRLWITLIIMVLSITSVAIADIMTSGIGWFL